jgi:proline racemase
VTRRIRTIDAHSAGEPLRLIVEGYPAPKGRTMIEKRAWITDEHTFLVDDEDPQSGGFRL